MHPHPENQLRNSNRGFTLVELVIVIAVLGITAGWALWLEVGARGKALRWAGWVWPSCFVLIGLLLLSYREA